MTILEVPMTLAGFCCVEGYKFLKTLVNWAYIDGGQSYDHNIDHIHYPTLNFKKFF